MRELSDAELALAMASSAGSNPAEAELYRRFAPRIELYGRRHLGSHAAAKDLVQEVLLEVVEAVRNQRLQNPASLAAFVLGTCRNVTWDVYRSERRRERIVREAAALASDAHAAPEPLDGGDVV